MRRYTLCSMVLALAAGAALAACTRPAPDAGTFPTLPPVLAPITETAAPEPSPAELTPTGTSTPARTATRALSATPTRTPAEATPTDPPPSDTPSPVAPALTDTPAAFTHIVQPGETLFRIATRYGISLDALRAANGLSGDLIFAGQSLIIPAGGFTPTPPA
jgi:LysM repeat protein